MITTRRLNGEEIHVNADLLERIESTPDTVLTFVDGKKIVVGEDADVIVERIVEFRARVLARAEDLYRTESSEPRSVPPLALLSRLREVD